MLTNRIDLRTYPTEICSHAHDFAQLVLPLAGSMEIEVGSYSGLVNDNCGVYIAPNEHHCFAGSASNLFLVIDIRHNAPSPNERPVHPILTLTTSTKKLIDFTHHYLTYDERDVFTDSLINQLLQHVSNKNFSLQPDNIVMKAKEWMEKFCLEPVNISKVAKHCCLSMSQLQRRFKLAQGCSMAEYWRMKKLQHAKWLLFIKDSSIEMIAFEVGYEQVSAFSRRFTQVFGESPSKWRTKARTAKKMRESDNGFLAQAW